MIRIRETSGSQPFFLLERKAEGCLVEHHEGELELLGACRCGVAREHHNKLLELDTAGAVLSKMRQVGLKKLL